MLDLNKKLENIIFVAPGGSHSLGLRQDGNVVAWVALTNTGRVIAWGCDRFGQSTVPASLGDVVMITAGRYHNLALRSNGTVFAWGNNKFGQCEVPDELVNAVNVSAGDYHSIALKSDGSVVVWGASGVEATRVRPKARSQM